MLTKREVIGFVLAPVPVIGPFLLMSALILSSPSPDRGDGLEVAAQLVLGSYAATLFIGLPIHLILRWKHQTRLAAYLGATVVVVALAGGLALVCDILFFPRSTESNPFGLLTWGRFAVTAMLAFTAVACLCAPIFWLVAVRRTRT